MSIPKNKHILRTIRRRSRSIQGYCPKIWGAEINQSAPIRKCRIKRPPVTWKLRLGKMSGGKIDPCTIRCGYRKETASWQTGSAGRQPNSILLVNYNLRKVGGLRGRPRPSSEGFPALQWEPHWIYLSGRPKLEVLILEKSKNDNTINVRAF